jgi:hypothetical protein
MPVMRKHSGRKAATCLPKAIMRHHASPILFSEVGAPFDGIGQAGERAEARRFVAFVDLRLTEPCIGVEAM